VGSLLQSGEFEAARELLEGSVSGRVEERPEFEPVVGRAELDAIHSAAARVAIPAALKDTLLELLRRLVVEQGCDEAHALLTDRSFLVKAVKLIRAQALLAGRERAAPEDLQVLAWMTTFRIPEEVHARIGELISAVSD
jgi:hypothetical protein